MGSRNSDKMNSTHQRKAIRLNKILYEEKGQPFSITICTHQNAPLFKEFGGLIFRSIKEGPLTRESDLMAACVMPDHVYLLVAPISENLIHLIGRWKSYTSLLIREKGYKGKIWQRSFYDHALREEEDIIKVAEYIVCNPVRRGMVQDRTDYLYSWHKWM